jgi:hypothetical protein
MPVKALVPESSFFAGNAGFLAVERAWRGMETPGEIGALGHVPGHGVVLPLTQGQRALIDVEDVEKVGRYRWHLKVQRKNPGKFYAQTTIRLSSGRAGRKTSIQLHRYLLDAGPEHQVDHINGDPLDNRRANLRLCSARENATNKVHSKNRKAGGFKGVSWNRNAGKWEAGIAAGEVKASGRRRRLYLGLFNDPVAAAHAYDAAALKYFGEFAALNFPQVQS